MPSNEMHYINWYVIFAQRHTSHTQWFVVGDDGFIGMPEKVLNAHYVFLSVAHRNTDFMDLIKTFPMRLN